MAEVTIISAGAALVGSGAWFAAKLFGPSVDALGNQLKAYFTKRIDSIFAMAGRLAADSGLEIAPVPAGLLARMIADASFSDDSDDITLWWANLFVDASVHASNKHAVFSDIMAFVGPAEARCLDDILNEHLGSDLLKSAIFRSFGSSGAVDAIKRSAEDWFPDSPLDGLGLHEELSNLIFKCKTGLPIKVIEWTFPVSLPSLSYSVPSRFMSPWYSLNGYSLDILRRSGVVDILDVELDSKPGQVKIVMPTALGVGFYNACKGHELGDDLFQPTGNS